MKETERMKDESVTAWDTFGKKTRMNSRDGGVPELTGFRDRTLSGLGTSLDSGLGRVTSSSEPEALSGSDFGTFDGRLLSGIGLPTELDFL